MKVFDFLKNYTNIIIIPLTLTLTFVELEKGNITYDSRTSFNIGYSRKNIYRCQAHAHFDHVNVLVLRTTKTRD